MGRSIATICILGLLIASCKNPIELTQKDSEVETPAPTPSPSASPSREPSEAIRMVVVKGGTFWLDGDYTKPMGVSTFKMGATEVTREQWLEVFYTDPSLNSYSTSVTAPVQYVTFYQAIAFCNKLSQLKGLTPAYSVAGVNFSTLTYKDIPTTFDPDWDEVSMDSTLNGYRLPTEMEWNWAAMGARNGDTGHKKPFAGFTGYNSPEYVSWFVQNSFGISHNVHSFGANELGLFDMSGNVWEYCWDVWDTLPTGAVTDYTGGVISSPRPVPYNGTTAPKRVIKGGSFASIDTELTLKTRTAQLGPQKNPAIGFRLAQKM